MELLKYMGIIRKKLWIIILITTVAALTSGLLSIFVLDPVYEAKTSLVVGRTSNSNNENDKVRYDDILMYQKLVTTYAELARSRLVIEEAISILDYDLKYEDLEKKLKVAPKGDTQILEIIIRDKSAESAVNIANVLTKIFLEKSKTVMNADDIRIMDAAQLPKKPVRPMVLLNIILSAFIGFMLSTGIILLIEYMDNTLKSEEDVQEQLGITVLASIPFTQKT